MTTAAPARHFIQEIIDSDIASAKWGGQVKTRFPPEPNGFLHIGHAKSICLNHALASEYDGTFVVRFDDTNPVKEEDRYVRAITEDIRWLGCDFGPEPLFASDYFQTMYDHAVTLVQAGKAYVDDLNAEEIRAHRGTLKEPGTESAHRDRSIGENLGLLERMRAGEFPDGSKTLRAKIDMASPNLNMRDPVMYRILHASHHRTSDEWCLYPMYDWAHGLEDSIEGITHSICTLEFESHRPLYDWFLDKLDIHHPQQIEFARLNLSYTVLSKRKLLQLVNDGVVSGWDDPRMPTLSALRRRGYTPESIRAFCAEIGVTKFNSVIDVTRLENACREHLNKIAERRMAVLDPLKVTITNWPAGEVDMVDAINNPEDESAGSRKIPFSGTLYIERADFMEDAPKKFFRLAPDKEVRLRYAYWIRCTDVIKNDAGEITELLCTYDPETRGGESPPDGRKVKGTLHWVSAKHAIDAEVRLFDRLFSVEAPDRKPKDAPESWDFTQSLNPDSCTIIRGAKCEPALADSNPGDRVQFERTGYFCVDADSATGAPVFNRTVSLKDSWSKQQK